MLAITLILDIYLAFTIIYAANNKKDWVYMECEPNLELITYNPCKMTYTKEQVKEKIDNLLNPWGFIYIESNFNKNDILAYTIIPARIVVIKPNLTVDDYAWAYTHELIHLLEFVGNERYTNYKTFVTLYESGDKQLMALAERYAYFDMQNKIHLDYSCWYYIKEYLLEKQVLS